MYWDRCKTFSSSPWRRDVDVYNDHDLASDLNSLSFNERQTISEEIHGVSGEITETPEFAEKGLSALRKIIDKVPSGGKAANVRRAFDRALFLRPSMQNDDRFLLMFLRAQRFDVNNAASLLFLYFEQKLELFGEYVLCRKIMLPDLTEAEVELVKSGANLLLSGRERTGRCISYAKLSAWDISDWRALVRSVWYVNTSIEDLEGSQKNGGLLIIDICGNSKHSPMEILNYLSRSRRLLDAYLFRVEGLHLCYDNPGIKPFVEGLLGIFSKNFRMRHRVHYGSSLEIAYSLRTFGIDIADCMQPGTGFSSPEKMDEYLELRESIDKPIRDREAAFQKSTSPFALYPNKIDVILGKSLVAATWYGNLLYKKFIEAQALKYIEASAVGRRVDKTLVAIETLHILQKEYGSRFLLRGKDGWDTVSDAENKQKVSQALRVAAKSHTK